MTHRETITEQDLETLEQYAEQAEQQAEAAELLEAVPSVVQRGGIYLISSAVVISLVLLWFGRAHSVVSATGQIVPKGESIPVQVLEGGVVIEVLSQPGDRLLAGDPILRVDRTRSGMSLAALERQLVLQETQLGALRADSVHLVRVLANPDAFARRPQPPFLSSSSQQLASALRIATLERLDAEQNGRERHEQRREQIRRDVDLAQQRFTLLEQDRDDQAVLLTQAEGDLKEFRSMAERGFFSEQDVRAEEQKFRQQKKRLETANLDIANERIRMANLEAELDTDAMRAARELEQARTGYSKSVTDLQVYMESVWNDISRLLAELANTRDEMGLLRQRVENTSVLAPVTGTLAGMEISNTGTVVSAGEIVGVIIPEGSPLVVKAEVPNKDIGFIHEGLDVRVKVHAFPFQQFGTVPGRVAKVYPNAGGSQNFIVLIELLETSIQVGDQAVSLFPGLTVDAEMLTTKQRLLTILLSSENEAGAQ